MVWKWSDMAVQKDSLKTALPRSQGRPWGSVLGSMLLTAAMLAIVQLMVEMPMLMLDRFFPGTGWLEIIALVLYAGFLTPKILNPATSIQWRTILWLVFSIVFFTQLTLGIFGFERFLMTGKLHLPIPALIIGGPVYRGEGFFMTILFGATLIFIGPAWCSYFCYIGGWDFLASQRLKKPRPMPAWRQPVRIFMLVLVISVAYLLRKSGVDTGVAVWTAAIYGLGGIAVIVFFSRRAGNMVHCITYCPIGAVANVLGKISPFRLQINEGCTHCRKCARTCRYDALRLKDLKRKKPGLSCTLCGDCIGSCGDSFITYRFLGLSPEFSRKMFVVLVVSFHAVCIGIARI